MLCGKMSGDRSPLRRSVGSHNSSGSSIVSFHGSWAQEMHSDQESTGRRSLNKSAELSSKNDQNDLADMSLSQETGNPNQVRTSQDREISLEFIEGVNEEKFERLLKEDKLKTPFKRRYSQTPSNGSGSNSPNDTNSDSGAAGGGGGAGADGDDHGNFKRSTHHKKDQHDVQKRLRYNSYGSGTSSRGKQREKEDDPAILARRQKQIDYGKNTLAYERFVETVPMRQRTRNHPHTPDKYGKYSRRTFDGLIKVWRKQLHYYDPEPTAGTAGVDDDDSD